MRIFMKRLRNGWLASRPRGISLIEILIALAISAIILIAVLALYMEGQKQFFNQNSRADTIEEIRTDMSRISRDIRDAANVANDFTAHNGQKYTTAVDCVVLEVPSIDGSGLIIPGSLDRIIYSYDPVNNQLVKIISPLAGARQNQRTVMAGNLVSPASGLPPFNLKYFSWDGTTEVASAYADPDDGAFIIEVELTAQGRSIHRSGRPFVETFRTQAKMRNKVVPIPG
jgi:prepilin-type N-terminal cleavage/methylation domain-containing protein